MRRIAIALGLGSLLLAGGGVSAAPPVTVPQGYADAVPEGLSTGDWAGIRGAYEAGRHAVRPVGSEHRAENPGQRWLTRFDGRGFSVQPDAGGW
ncbi:MAG: hypothetical protein VX246_13845, partial [Myxococcota bacterium]|nr:hypothetical protein [Myxococcota bacterium]